MTQSRTKTRKEKIMVDGTGTKAEIVTPRPAKVKMDLRPSDDPELNALLRNDGSAHAIAAEEKCSG